MFSRTSTNVTAAAILVLLAGVQAQLSVTLSPLSICAVEGSTVIISCRYSPPHYSSVTDTEWYLIFSNGEKRVLEKDSRVSVETEQNKCDLIVWGVRVSDSGVYNFRFKTSESDWIPASSGVNLTVTELQVLVDPNTIRRSVKLSCSATCSLGTDINYFWYRNGENLENRAGSSILLDSTSPSYQGSYTCGVSGSSYHSPPVCVSADSQQKSCWSVAYRDEAICDLIGSSAYTSCQYSFPDNLKVSKTMWFIKDQADAEPVDVREDEQYKGRVQNRQNFQRDCTMKIRDLRDSDAQTYRFRFYTDEEKYTGNPGVTLSVSDLEITVSDTESGGKKLTCSSSCTLSNPYTYIWYKDEQTVSGQSSNELYLDDRTEDAGYYSCAVNTYKELRSPTVCVFDQSRCWNISYSTRYICALIGATVDIDSYYTFPDQHPDPQPAWYIRLSSQDTELSPADGRVEFVTDRPNVHTLRLRRLTQIDSARYLLRFKAPYREYTPSSAGVHLSITGLQVKVKAEGQTVELICSTTCTLPNNPTYIWYKNRQNVFHCRSAVCSVAVVSGAVEYSCAVEDHDGILSPPVYSPRNTTAVLVSSGEMVEGDSVTLSCSSDADPPDLFYFWFKKSNVSDTQLSTGQNYTISNISSQHSGLYYCSAHNQLGQHSSSPIHLDVSYTDSSAVIYAVSGVAVVLILLIIAGFLLMRKRTRATSSRREENKGTHASIPVYETVSDQATASALTTTAASGDQDGVQYSSVQFKRPHTEEVALYSTVHHPKAHMQADDVVYSTVKPVQ